MSDTAHRPEPGPRANPAQVKGDIDAGETGDKAPGFDPGAAPLGTDEEAAGPMVSGRAEAQERVRERRGRPEQKRPNAVEPALAPDASQPRQAGRMTVAALIGVAAGVGLALVYLAV